MFFIGLIGLSLIGGSTSFAATSEVSFKGTEIIGESDFLKSTYVEDQKLARYEDGAMDGGWWTRGKNGNRLISEYKHYTKQGRASCRNGNGTFSDGGWNPVGYWSKSSVGYTVLGGNNVYYDYR